MQMIFIVLIIFLLVLVVVLFKQLHLHVSTKTVERKVSDFLEQHLENHKAKTVVTKPKTKKISKSK